MKVILNVGGTQFIAPSAATAAKVMELLKGMTPIGHRYSKTEKVLSALVIGSTQYNQDTTVRMVPDETVLTEVQWQEWNQKMIEEHGPEQPEEAK